MSDENALPQPVDEDYSFAPFRQALGQDYLGDDPDLQVILRHHGLLDEGKWERLRSFGKFAATRALAVADESDRPDQLPQLTPFDAWGRPHPVGVQVHEGTQRILAASLRAGVATEPDVFLRYGMAYLGAQVSDHGVMCPMACTDGLTRALQELGGGEQGKAALEHILSQASEGPVHAAQFVTEVQGGSDAATNTLRAVPQGDGSYRLYGKKWFCSNPWAQYWAVTARPDGAPAGPRGIALFLVHREHPEGTANGFRLDRLKDKLGTRTLPTAEMTLDGALAWPVGDLDAGLSNMVRIVLTTSRFWNALASAASLRATERIITAYADFREAFGKPLRRYPLVAHTIEQISGDRRNFTAAIFEVLRLWQETMQQGIAAQELSREQLLRSRVWVMLAKTCATRRNTARLHDAMMILGGNGIEERFSALPRLWRDAAILETWEGPHGLLLARSLYELQRLGAVEDPKGVTRTLLGAGAAGAATDALGERLAGIVAEGDEQRRMVAFSDWAQDLYDRFGELSWAEAAG